MKPIIGICTNYTTDDMVGIKTGLGMQGQEWQLLANDYIVAIERAGGIPLIVPITDKIETTYILLQKLDGILFTGGSDIDPQYYNELPKYGLQRINSKRDKHEIKLVQHVIESTSLPILAICRGMQLLTVATGGSLYQDIRLERSEGINHTIIEIQKHYPVHRVSIKEGSLFHQIFKEETIGVNSFNHQAVKKLGMNCQATMLAPDGLIEGIEYYGKRFVAGVQWHPEMMVEEDQLYLKLFDFFVKECIKKKVRN